MKISDSSAFNTLSIGNGSARPEASESKTNPSPGLPADSSKATANFEIPGSQAINIENIDLADPHGGSATDDDLQAYNQGTHSTGVTGRRRG